MAKDGTQEVDEEVETDNSASTRTVKASTRRSMEELREVEPSRMQALTPWGREKFCVQTLTPWGGGEFRDLEVSTPAERLATRHERIGLDICWRDGQTRLVLMGENPVWSEERPLDGRDKGSVVDILEIWTFRNGKPAAVCTDGGAHFGGLLRAWCGYHSIEHRICSWPRPLRSGGEMTNMLLPAGQRRGDEQTMAFPLPFWMQGRDCIWQRGGCELLTDHRLVLDMRHVFFFPQLLAVLGVANGVNGKTAAQCQAFHKLGAGR